MLWCFAIQQVLRNMFTELCICSNASNLSAVRGLDIGIALEEIFGETSGCGVGVVSGESLFA